MQAAFRAQNPCMLRVGSEQFRKQNAYVFDFDPARTLIIFDEFANNLRPETAGGNGTGEDREQNIRRLLNFFPVLGEDEAGSMVELDPKQVLSIPRRIKCQEVVRHGFMSNFLFRNIANVFGAPQAVRDILEKLQPAHEEKGKSKTDLKGLNDVQVDKDGEVQIDRERVIGTAKDLFGDKIYEEMAEDVQPALDALQGSTDREIDRQVKQVLDKVKQVVDDRVFKPVEENGGVKKRTIERIRRETHTEVERQIDRAKTDYQHGVNVAEDTFHRQREQAMNETELREAENTFETAMNDLRDAFMQQVTETTRQVIQDRPQQVTERIEKAKDEEKKRTIEDDVRSRLRGFCRTIPSFMSPSRGP